MPGWVAILVPGVLAALGGGGGLYAFLTIGSTKRKVNAETIQIKATADETIADTVKVLIGGAADLVEPLKRELAEARLDIARLRQETNAIELRFRRLIVMIHQPAMTLPRLREMVPLEWETPVNGRDS
jgi:predicted ATP-grasp superfamily ATP-dependent carboligase